MNASLAVSSSSQNADMSQAAASRDPQITLYLSRDLNPSVVFAGLQTAFQHSEIAAMLGVANPIVSRELAKIFGELSLRSEIPQSELVRVTDAFARSGASPDQSEYELRSSARSSMLTFGGQTKLHVLAMHATGEDGYVVSEVSLHLHAASSRAAVIGEAFSLGKNWSTSYNKGMDVAEAVSDAVSHTFSTNGSFL